MTKTSLADALPKMRVSEPYTFKKHYVTPYIPREAARTVEYHERTIKMPVLILAMEIVSPVVCQNCGGVGKIFLKLTKAGPFQNPPAGVATWFDGNGRFGKGWYVVEDTMIIDCPECGGGVK